MEQEKANYETFNVGSGTPSSIRDIAECTSEFLGKDIKPDITMKFRKGDVRHCIADNSKLHNLLGFVPQTAIEDGLKEVIEWSGTTHAEDRFDEVTREWKEKGLV